MSKSRKKNPAGSICVIRAGEQKQYKKYYHKRIRQIHKKLDYLYGEDTYTIPNHCFYDAWNSPSDGKYFYMLPYYEASEYKTYEDFLYNLKRLLRK